MKVAITGASGFIGINLSLYLRERGHEVVPIVRTAEKVGSLRYPGLDIRIGDVTDPASLAVAFKNVEVVVHLAALFNDPDASKQAFYRVNVEGTKNVLEMAQQCGVRRVVHCSTVGVTTASGSPPYSEKTPYAPPLDKYETSKCEGEQLALGFHRRQGLPVVVIRPAQVYGPGDTRKAKFYKMVQQGIIVNPGHTMKHLVYIDDLSRAFEMAMASDKAVGEIFIIAGENAMALQELVHIVARELGVPAPRIRLPATPITYLCAVTEVLCQTIGVKPPLFRRSMDFFTRSVEFDVTKARTELGFRSQIDIPTGVARTVAWYREKGLL